jgi:uncharacterized protein
MTNIVDPLGRPVHAGSPEHDRKPNRLISEKSPYLLQHAYNPVDWFPWGEEAFAKARQEDKPIFLSIGYSTCHWCHVMEHESFEDSDVARAMNEAFVAIKVDREERPDIDHTYMTVCQMLTGSGGWPLNIVMTPDKKPFFAGTYFPRESVHGRIGMIDLSLHVKEIWAKRRDEAAKSADQVMNALLEMVDDSPGNAPGTDVLTAAYEQLTQRFDNKLGGFSQAPKFPTPHNMLFLLRYWHRTGEANALRMVEATLKAMSEGGIYDHIGFGFHRYSTDAHWLVPHFEKMLYDQALLAMTYTEAYQATGRAEYRKTAEAVIHYVLRDMTAPEGGFYSAEDADSEGEEGKFYVWTLDQVERVLDRDDTDLMAQVLNVHTRGNFREEATGRITGANILHLRQSLEETAGRLDMSLEALETRLEQARSALFAAREKRVHPHKDDKVLTDWNGLMIAALAKAAQAFDRPDYSDAATRAARFILGTLRTANGRLLHRFRQGTAGLPAHVDDYAFLVWGLLELYEATFDVRWLHEALDLNQKLLDHFWDDRSGGLFFTADDETELPVRRKEIYDGATPSGNSVAALNLLRLGRITGNPAWERKADQLASAFAGSIGQFPSAYTQLLVALEFAHAATREVVISGHKDSEDTRELIRALRRPFVPNKVVLFRPVEQGEPDIATIAAYTRDQIPVDGKATAYVCVNYACGLPTTDPERMLHALTANKP